LKVFFDTLVLLIVLAGVLEAVEAGVLPEYVSDEDGAEFGVCFMTVADAGTIDLWVVLKYNLYKVHMKRI
jgi:hypothetical protein